MFAAENFIRSLVTRYGKHAVYTDGGTWYRHACNFLTFETSIIFTFREKSN